MTAESRAEGRALGLVDVAMGIAEEKAWKALGQHDYHGFAKHAAEWGVLAKIIGHTGPSPFRGLVQQGRAQAEINKRMGERNG